MPDNDETLRLLKRIDRKVTLTMWVVGVPVVLLGLFWLVMVLVGPSVEMT